MRLTSISYCPSTGVVSKYGKPINSVDDRGYKYVSVNGKPLRQHRVAWYLMYGFLPKEIDHINRDKLDNRAVNLRACTRSTNTLNVGLRSDNTSGVKGVSFKKESGKWLVHYKGKHVGYYTTFEEAVEARHELDRRS